MTKAFFYHAGCPVCVSAEQQLLETLDRGRFDIHVIHLGQDAAKIADAEQAGVLSVPALVVNKTVFHINFGAALADLKGGVA